MGTIIAVVTGVIQLFKFLTVFLLAEITYNIKNVAEVNYIFSFVSSETGMFTEDSDLVVVDILVKNISKKTNVYSLRGVFDTIFGDSKEAAFGFHQ